MTSDPPNPHSPVDEELENELDNFITLQQQLQNPNKLTIHHLSQTMTSSESFKQASTTEETRFHRVFKRKHPNAQMPLSLVHLECFQFTLFTTTQRNSYKCAYHFFQDTLTIKLILTTINELKLTNMPCFPHFHIPHTILSVTPCQSHYIITQTTMSSVTLDYIT